MRVTEVKFLQGDEACVEAAIAVGYGQLIAPETISQEIKKWP